MTARNITSSVGDVVDDVKYGVRLLRRSPGFGAAAILTIALGIGAATAMFSIVYGVVLQPLPYADPERLVNVWNTAPALGRARSGVTMANVYDWRARNHVFEAIGALRPIANYNLTGGGGEPERLSGARVEAKVFHVLGVRPLVGRTFAEDEDEIGHERVAVLSYGLWKRRFAGDPAVVGRTISLSGESFVVVGVMPRGFAYPSREYQIWTPLTFDPRELVNRDNYNYFAVARLEQGVTVQRAQAEMTVIAAQIAREHPKENAGIGVEIAPMHADTVTSVRAPLYLLLAAVVAMLLIGCANLANLLLARALVRRREIAVRAALGATRGRLLRQSIAELVPMLAIGGVLGVASAKWTIDLVVPMLPADVPRAENVALPLPVLLFAAATLAAIAALVGLWPALEAARGELAAAAADSSRTATTSARRTRLRDALVVGQIAATLWLAIGAALLTRSLAELKRVDPGFNPDGVYSLHLAIPRTKYGTDRAVNAFCTRVLERVVALPGVVSAGMVNRLPLAGGTQTAPFEFEGVDPGLNRDRLGVQADFRSITPDYFRTLAMPLVSGRAFTDADSDESTPVAIVDDRLARMIFGAASPLGRRLRVSIAGEPWATIVGVVGHVHHDRLDEDGRSQIYWPYHQRGQDRMALVVRTRGNPAAIASSLVAAIHSVDPEQPVYDARTLDAVVDRSLGQRWFQTTVLGSFAVVALLLASIGVYGVIAYGVNQRAREFGIRLALGASRGDIVALVLWRGTFLFVAGAVLGLVAAMATERVLGTLVFGVRASDAISFGSATAVLLAVSLAACALPARRAGRVDPSVALRAE